MHQLRTDAVEIFGTVAAAEEWIKNPSLTWQKTNLNSVKPKLLGTREHHLTCLNPECNRKFATLAERNYHMHIAHTTHINNSIEDESKPFACPIASCNMRYRREGWLTRHIEQCHQASEEAPTPPPTTTTPATKTNLGSQHLNSSAPFVQNTANKKRNDPPLLFKASIFRAQGHVSERNHCWDDCEVVGI